MKTIGLLIPYFGQLPPWINLFLETCRNNPSITFHLLSDSTKPENCPTNMYFEKMDLAEFNRLASKKLEQNICFKRIFKICDLKPAYGRIFEDIIKQYDWWGYTEVDLLFGDIRHFLTDDLLETEDIITSDHRFMAGHFSIFKNKNLVNALFQKSRSFKDICSIQRYTGFDEVGPTLAWAPEGPVLDLVRDYESLTHLVISARREGLIRSHFGLPYVCDYFLNPLDRDWATWKDGYIECRTTSSKVLYFHFQKSKKDQQFLANIPNYKNMSLGLNIGINGFTTTYNGDG